MSNILEVLWLRRERKRRAQKTIEGAPPLTYTAKNAGTLTDYRIYGQTENGESVGDLETTGEHAGEYKVPVTVEGKNLYKISTFRDGSTSTVAHAVTFTINNDAVSISGVSSAQYPQVTSQRFELISGETYSAKIFVDGSYDGKIYIMMHGGEQQDGSDEINYKRINVGSGDTFVAKTYNSIIYVMEGTNKEFNAIVRVMLIKGSTLPDTYEPYHAPVTTPIYLPEQIRKVGDNAEYIDYAEQKQHFVGGTSVDVTLPALPTIAGTNTLSVGTEVQPSKVMVRGKIIQE